MTNMFLNSTNTTNFALPFSSLEIDPLFQSFSGTTSSNNSGLIPLGMNQLDSLASMGVLSEAGLPQANLLVPQQHASYPKYSSDDLYSVNSDAMYFAMIDQKQDQHPPLHSFSQQQTAIVVEKGGEEIDSNLLLYGKVHLKQEVALVNTITTPDEKETVSPVVTNQSKKNAFWTIRSYENCPATAKVQAPQFKYCKKKRNHFSQDFPQIAYKSPYKYNLRLSVGCNCGNKGHHACCKQVKSWAEEVKISLDLVLEDTLQTAKLPEKPSTSPISVVDTHFNTSVFVNGSSFEAVMSAFQMNVCSYNMGGSKFRLIVKISRDDDLMMSLISPSFVIKAKKPIWKPGIKNRSQSEESLTLLEKKHSENTSSKKNNRKKRSAKEMDNQSDDREVIESDDEPKTVSSQASTEEINVAPSSPKKQKLSPISVGTPSATIVPPTPTSPVASQMLYRPTNQVENLVKANLMLQQFLYQKQFYQIAPQIAPTQPVYPSIFQYQQPRQQENEEPLSTLDFLLFEELNDPAIPLL